MNLCNIFTRNLVPRSAPAATLLALLSPAAQATGIAPPSGVWVLWLLIVAVYSLCWLVLLGLLYWLGKKISDARATARFSHPGRWGMRLLIALYLLLSHAAGLFVLLGSSGGVSGWLAVRVGAAAVLAVGGLLAGVGCALRVRTWGLQSARFTAGALAVFCAYAALREGLGWQHTAAIGLGVAAWLYLRRAKPLVAGNSAA